MPCVTFDSEFSQGSQTQSKYVTIEAEKKVHSIVTQIFPGAK